MASKKTEAQLLKDQEAAKAFAEDLKAVEAKHGMRVIPMLEYSHQGVFATLGHQRVDKVELNADKKV